ncbi:MAG: hypothetical protein K8R89_07470 [Anaerolineae bacterium]|nr:hypothetical protein [Anaerolineae bacterium]
MNKKIRWLRISYWTGAILDGLAAVQMLVPAVFAATNKLPDFHPGADYKYAMGMGASLMLGWTVLLVWADRKPMERKGVLPITIFPVILGMVANEIWAVSSHFVALGVMVPSWIMQTVLIALFAFSYLNARDEQGASKSAFF